MSSTHPIFTEVFQLVHGFLKARLCKLLKLACAHFAGKKMVGEQDLRVYLDKWDRKYWATYKVLDILQKVFYRSNPAREAFVEMCESDYVQKMTFDSYLYKTVVPGNPLDDAKLLLQVNTQFTSSHQLRLFNLCPFAPCTGTFHHSYWGWSRVDLELIKNGMAAL